jgi:hypothetical protein
MPEDDDRTRILVKIIDGKIVDAAARLLLAAVGTSRYGGNYLWLLVIALVPGYFARAGEGEFLGRGASVLCVSALALLVLLAVWDIIEKAREKAGKWTS